MSESLAHWSTFVLAVLAYFALITAWRQIREARKARTVLPFIQLVNTLNDQREARKLLFEHWEEKNGNKLNCFDGKIEEDEWMQSFEKVVVWFDIAGLLTQQELIREDLFLKLYWDVILKTWASTKWYIDINRGHSETYLADFESLQSSAVTYMKSLSIPALKFRNEKIVPT